MNVPALLESRAGRAALLLARVLFWVAAATLAYALCRRGIQLSDEGDVLTGALGILQGKVPYRDIDMFVTPGVWYLNAAVFALAGTSVIATRLAAAACLLATMAVTRRIVAIVGGPLWGDLAAGLIAIFAVWAWPAWTWSFYSPWATLFSLAGLGCTLEWMRSRRRSWLVACGFVLGLAIAFKQNYGVFAAAGCMLALVLDEIALGLADHDARRVVAGRILRAALPVALGGALVLVPGVLWLAWQGALPAAFDLLLLRPFQGFIDSHSIRYIRFGDFWRQLQIWTVGGLVYMAVPFTTTSVSVRWPSPAISLVVLLHIALYWIPVFAFAGFGLRGLSRLRQRPNPAERGLLAVTVFSAVYFLGVFPRADFNHLINVYQPFLAMLAAGAALVFGQGRWRRSAPRRWSAGAAVLLLLCYGAVAAVWMNDLRKTVWLPLQSPRAGVLVEDLESQMINSEVELVRTLTEAGEPVFALPNLAMIPFLAERPMPTRFHNFYAVHIGHDAGREAAHDIERSGARVVLVGYDNFFSDPGGMLTYGGDLVEYLRRHFRPTLALGGYRHLVLTRREEPLDEAPARGLWMHCKVPTGGASSAFVREHVLFRTLYHSFRGAWAAQNQRTTFCELLVPSQGRLRVTLGLRQPTAADSPASIRSEIWLFRSRGHPELVLEREWPLATDTSWMASAGEEFEVDLARWEGQVVNLLLRTVVEGTVPSSQVDHLGLSMMWNDGRLESPEFADATDGEDAGNAVPATLDAEP